VTDENLRLAPHEALLLAQELIDSGRPFHAHEVLEAAWKAAPAAERGLWKGLAQLAVGLTHARRANAVGAVALLRRGAEAVGAFGSASDGIIGQTASLVDATGICAAAQALAGRIERDGLDSVPSHEVTLTLMPHS
jgi:predicted metal-dependent hydrolase